MYLQQSRNSSGRVYLSIVQGYRQDGKVKHRTIEKIGYLDELQKEYEDPIAHFKEEAKRRTEELPKDEKIEIDTGARLADDTSERKNLGYCIPKRIYSLLGIRDFFQNKQRQLKIGYNLNSIFSMLTFNRFLCPSSKKKAYEEAGMFFEPRDYSLDDVYRALSFFNKYSLPFQQFLNERVTALVGRDSSTGYYDVTNYYFEIPYNDPDETDEDGKLAKKGFRHVGPSKEHRRDPIVQMGLLMDRNGIPMAFNTFSGGDSEKTSLLPTVRRVKRDYNFERIIIVADRGLNTSDNTVFLAGINDDDTKDHDGYVYGQSVLGADKEFREWVLSGDYKKDMVIDKDGEKVSFTHKSRLYAKTVTLKGLDGKRNKKMVIYQKQMVYYSQKYADKQAHDRELMIAKAQDLINNPGRYTKSTAYGAAAYISNIAFSKDTGEIVKGRHLSIDQEKINEESKYDGYYSIVTSEKDLSDKEIRDIYKGLWEIEESFKIIKSEFRARPAFVRTEDHLNAHFLICFTSLLIMRVIELMTDKQYSFHQIRESLKKYSCSYLEKNYYLCDYRDETLIALEKRFEMDFSRKYLSRSDIKKMLAHKKA